MEATDQNPDTHAQDPSVGWYGSARADELAASGEASARVVCARDVIAAAPETIFELIANPMRQPDWDGNDNLAHAESGEPVTGIGDVFVMTLTNGQVRDNHIVEFEADRLIAWKPASAGDPPAGHLWRWVLTPREAGGTEVTHIYDWSGLQDETRIPRAQGMTSQMLHASVLRLKGLAEAQAEDR